MQRETDASSLTVISSIRYRSQNSREKSCMSKILFYKKLEFNKHHHDIETSELNI